MRCTMLNGRQTIKSLKFECPEFISCGTEKHLKGMDAKTRSTEERKIRTVPLVEDVQYRLLEALVRTSGS